MIRQHYRDAKSCGNCIYSSPPDEDCNHYCCDLDGDCPPHGNYIEAEEIMFKMWEMTHATREDCVCDGFDNDWRKLV